MGLATGSVARGLVVSAIAGGFVRVEVATLLHAWRTCQGYRGGSGDFRVWLAAHEMVARRGKPIGGASLRKSSFQVHELARLANVGDRRARDAVRRLNEARILDWSTTGDAIGFPAVPPETLVGLGEGVDATLPGLGGTLSIPRRILRFLAEGARPALIATVLAVLLRCVSRRRSGFGSRGRVKASWVARVFEVDVRGVKAARSELVALGWLSAEGGAGDQWSWNRWGRVYQVHLDWAAPVADKDEDADRPPLDPETGAGSPPPDLDPDPLPELKSNPEPVSNRPSGICQEPRRTQETPTATLIPSPAPTGEPSSQPSKFQPTSVRDSGRPRPSLNDILPLDLASVDRTLDLHRQAVEVGWSTPSEADRLRFVAAAAHAQAVGRSNPCGLFRAIVQGRRWALLTQADEDRARARLRDHDRGQASPSSSKAPRRPVDPTEPTLIATILARFPFASPN